VVDEAGPEHLWRLAGVELDVERGATSVYECERCPATIVVWPGEEPPGTA
jgi:hypothetical protein